MTHVPEPLFPAPKMSPEEKKKLTEELLRPIQLTPPDQPPGIITLDNLFIEEKSPGQGNDKILQAYDKSLQSLRSRNCQRHLRPDEAFRILIDAIENPNSKYKSISDDMLFSYGEWLSLAGKRKSGTKLHLYNDPDGTLNNYEFIPQNFKYLEEKIFTIDKDIQSGTYVDLDRFPNDLVTFLYSRPFDKLPDVIKSGNRRAQLWLPKQGIIRPFGRGDDFCNFNLNANYDDRASRGVSERR